MRVLWYGKWFPVDGNYIYLNHVTRRQAGDGHTVAVAYHGRDDLNAQRRDDRIKYLPLPSLHPGPSWAIESLATPHALERHIKSFRPDVVHASLRVGTFDLRLPALCARLDVPLVLTFHVAFSRDVSTASSASAAIYALYGRALASATATVALGPEQRRWLRRFSGVQDARIHEIPNGVDYVRFRPGPSEWRRTISEPFVVGYVGRLAPEKNIEALCRGFLQAGLRDARLVIVGQGPSAEKLRKRFGSHPSISLLPAVDDRDRIADLMRGLDVFVLPSLIEGLSLSLLEAMASGVVPVATEVGEHHSLVDGCGVLLRPATATDGVRRALVELEAHPERRKTLAVAARTRAQLTGWDRTATEVVELYRKVV